MINLEIKDIWSSDVEDVNNWHPDDRSDVCLQLSFEVGKKDERGANIFQVVVATPKGLSRQMNKHNLAKFSDRNLMVYQIYSFLKVIEDIENIMCKCQSATFEESMIKLQRYFLWEYEDYKVD